METIAPQNEPIDQVWQSIPLEDKSEILSKAQTTAVSVVAMYLLFAWAIAVGLRQPWFLWGSCLFVPILFQIAANKAWCGIKPRLIIEYTAARATSVFYAIQARGQNLTPLLQFRGAIQIDTTNKATVQGTADQEADLGTDESGELGALKDKPVWITLFPDSLVIFSETARGSHRELACSLFEEISVSNEAPDDYESGSPYLIIKLRLADGSERRWILNSANRSHLNACYRKLQGALERKNFLNEQSWVTTPG